MRIVVLGGGRAAVGIALAAAGARSAATPNVDVTIVARDPIETASLAPDCRALRRGALPLPPNVRLASLDTPFAVAAVADADGVFCALPSVALQPWLHRLAIDAAAAAPIFLAARGAVNYKNATARAVDTRSAVRPKQFEPSLVDDSNAADILLPHELLRMPLLARGSTGVGSADGALQMGQHLSRRLFSVGCMGAAADLTAAARYRLGATANLEQFRQSRLHQRAQRVTSEGRGADQGAGVFPSLPFLNDAGHDGALPALPLLAGTPLLIAASRDVTRESCDAATTILNTIGFAHHWVTASSTSRVVASGAPLYSLGRVPVSAASKKSPERLATGASSDETTDVASATVELLDAATLAAAFGGGLCARAFGSTARASSSSTRDAAQGGAYTDGLLSDEARLLDPSGFAPGGSIELARGATRAFVDQIVDQLHNILTTHLHQQGRDASGVPQPARDALYAAASTPGAGLAFELGRRVYDAATPSDAVETLISAQERHRYDALYDSLTLLAHAESCSAAQAHAAEATHGSIAVASGPGIFTALLHTLTGYRKAVEVAPKLAVPAALWAEHTPASRLQEGLEMIDSAMHRGEAPEPIAAKFAAGLNLTANVSDLGNVTRGANQIHN
jgi:hypothetical protein